MNKQYLLLLTIITIVVISSVGITHAVDLVQNDKKKTAVLFQATNMNVTTSTGWELVDLGKRNGVSSGMIFFSERYALLTQWRSTAYLDSFGTGIVVGGKTDGITFEVHTLSNSNKYGLVELIFTGPCDVDVGMGTYYTDFQVTWKQTAFDNPSLSKIISIQPHNDTNSHFRSICQTP